MICTNILNTIDHDGKLTSTIVRDDGSSLYVSYCIENIYLIGKEIKMPKDAMNLVLSQSQTCPYCHAPIHLTSHGTFCYNIGCSIRERIFQQHMELLKIQVDPKIIIDVVNPRLYKDKDYNILKFIRDARTSLNVDFQSHVRGMSITRYLKLLRIPAPFDEGLSVLEHVNMPLELFIGCLLNGSLVEYNPDLLETELKAAILMSLMVNRTFATDPFFTSSDLHPPVMVKKTIT